MDIYTFGEGLRQRFEQAGKIVFEKAQQIFSDAEPIANDAKSVVAKAFEDSQRAAAKVDLGRAIENAQGAVHRAVKDVQGAAKNIDLNRFGTDIQKNAADAVDAINEAANNLHIEQLLSNSFADAENMAKIISHNADLPGAIGAAQGWVDESLRFAEEKASGIDLGHIFDDAKVWAVAHPIQTAFIVINILILFAPGLITGPLLSITGFGAEGITAGSLAATWHSNAGPIAAGSIFAGLQSAGAAGGGLSIVNGVIQGGAFIAETLMFFIEATRSHKLDASTGQEAKLDSGVDSSSELKSSGDEM